MKETKAEGKTIQEAIERGLAKLSLRRDQAEVEIIEEGKKGLLGIGAKKALVSVREKKWNPSEKRRDEKNGRRNFRSRKRNHRENREQAAAPPGENDAAIIAKEAGKILSQILTLSGVKFSLKSSDYDSTSGKIIVKFESSENGFLFENHGKGIEALQYLVNAILHKNFRAHPAVRLNTGDFWERREKDLVKKIEYGINFIRKNSRPFRMHPMSAPQRKMVHDIVKNSYPDFATYSEGEGKWRKVVLKAADKK